MKEYIVGVKKLRESASIKGPKDAAVLLDELRMAEVEVPMVLHLMPDLTVREVETCAVGSMMSVSVEARTIFAYALSKMDGRGIVLVHNHAFQRRAEPSVGDRDFAHGILLASQILGIQVFDSVVIGTKEDYSFMEKGLVFQKGSHYKPIVQQVAVDTLPINVKPDVETKVTTARRAVALLGSMTSPIAEPMLAAVHLTPDLEPASIWYYPVNKGDTPRDEARRVLRDAVLHPSTKYIVLVSNMGMFFDKRSAAFDFVSERLRHIRLGAMVLCIPVIDMIMVDKEGEYSFTEHGKELPKSKVYAIVEDEGMKLKGPSKTRRSDLPPYSWTFK